MKIKLARGAKSPKYFTVPFCEYISGIEVVVNSENYERIIIYYNNGNSCSGTMFLGDPKFNCAYDKFNDLNHCMVSKDMVMPFLQSKLCGNERIDYIIQLKE